MDRALQNLRGRLAAEGTLLGAFATISSGYAAELLASAGYDWICVDLQHGMVGLDALGSMFQAIQGTGTPALVRVSTNDPVEIGRALDAGADGVVVPSVSSRAEAEAAVAACRYPPDGRRSWGPARALLTNRSYTRDTPAPPLLAMIETRAGVEEIDRILDAGVDGVYVGPVDLSMDWGLEPRIEIRDPELGSALRGVCAACRRRGLAAGTAAPDPAGAATLGAEGWRLLSLSSDAALVRSGARAQLKEARAALGTAR